MTHIRGDVRERWFFRTRRREAERAPRRPEGKTKPLRQAVGRNAPRGRDFVSVREPREIKSTAERSFSERRFVNGPETREPKEPVEEPAAAPPHRPPMRPYGLLALGFLAGAAEHYVQTGLGRLAGFTIPFAGAIVAGAALGLVLRWRVAAMKPALFVLVILVARTATLYLDYARYRDRRIEQFAVTKRIADTLAAQKLALQAYTVEKVGGLSPKELFEQELRRLGGRADFIGYLRMLVARGMRDASGRRIASAWAVVLLQAASSAVLGASCVVLCHDTSFPAGPSGEEPAPDA